MCGAVLFQSMRAQYMISKKKNILIIFRQTRDHMQDSRKEPPDCLTQILGHIIYSLNDVPNSLKFWGCAVWTVWLFQFDSFSLFLSYSLRFLFDFSLTSLLHRHFKYCVYIYNSYITKLATCFRWHQAHLSTCLVFRLIPHNYIMILYAASK